MHNGETTTKKLTGAIFFWFYKPCHGAYTAVDTYRYIAMYNTHRIYPLERSGEK